MVELWEFTIWFSFLISIKLSTNFVIKTVLMLPCPELIDGAGLRWNKWENTQKKRSKETKSDNATVEEHFQKLVLERNLKDIFAIKED